MTTQSESKGHGWAGNVAAQIAIFLVAVVVLIAIASKYLW